jgi:hypothetical protein
MSSDERALEIINRMYAEASSAHGDDPLRIASAVEAQVEALDPGDRRAVRAAFQRMTTFAAAQWPDSDTRH